MSDLFGQLTTIPCLSLWEPWASLMATGFKLHETRHWPTQVRGLCAIHAAKTREGFDDAPEELCDFALGRGWRQTRPLGCVVAVGELRACLRTAGIAPIVYDCDLKSGNYGIGRFAFRFERVRPLIEPLPLKGRQGVFRWSPPADLEARLGPVVDHALKAAIWARRDG